MLAHFWPKLVKCFNEVKIPYVCYNNILFDSSSLKNMKHTGEIKGSEENK